MTQRMLAIVNEIDTYLHGEYITYISFGKHHGAMPLLPLAWTLMPLLSFSPCVYRPRVVPRACGVSPLADPSCP